MFDLNSKGIIRLAVASGMILTNFMNIYGQDSSSINIKKNSIYLDGATLIYIGMSSLNYERSIFLSNHYKLFVGAGFGGWYLYPIPKEYVGFSIPVSLNSLIGSGNNYFEADFGVRHTFLSKRSDKDRFQYFPVINFGYRFQRSNGKGLIFRSFIGYSGVGIGVGKAF
jgi:hypothetical protein